MKGLKLNKYPIYKQLDSKDCGPACLKMIAKYYGRNYSFEFLREKSYLTRLGVSMLGICQAAEHIGMRTLGVKISFDKLTQNAKLPCILHWNQNHFVVLYKIEKQLFSNKLTFLIGDPSEGIMKVNESTFNKAWTSSQNEVGLALLLEPTPLFYQFNSNSHNKKTSFRFFFQYLKPYAPLFVQLTFGLIFISLIELTFPFLTQSLVDTGISNQDIGFVNLILMSQLMLFFGKTVVEAIRSWILLHMSTRINISIISDFIIKIMKLPISFFESKSIGDITQRIGDHSRIESFMTNATLSILFSMLNLVIFSCIMAYYNTNVLLVFFIGSILSIVWITLFLKWRKELDYARFNLSSENQNNMYEMITGISEIKLNNAERQQRWGWERVQAKIFQLSIKGLSLGQFQSIGSSFIDQTKNITISYLTARAVISGEMTLGMMMSVSYIIGQMNGPINQFMAFFRSAQDAKISLDRLREVHENNDEDILNHNDPANSANFSLNGDSFLKPSEYIKLENLSFQYEGPSSPYVFKNLNLNIPIGKITAIVGTSGSGKSTLLKLLLKFYQPQKGEIKIGDRSLAEIPSDFWRSKCGVVMQDGYIFSTSIAENIAFGSEKINVDKLKDAILTANISDFIKELPLGVNTKIGISGTGLSQGQKQRLLISRAVYKDPEFLFFDEATSSLDANNEKVIMSNLNEYFKNKTVLIVAHRLSTVRNAHKIVVIEKGQIVEEGTHDELTERKNNYYELVKNQL